MEIRSPVSAAGQRSGGLLVRTTDDGTASELLVAIGVQDDVAVSLFATGTGISVSGKPFVDIAKTLSQRLAGAK